MGRTLSGVCTKQITRIICNRQHKIYSKMEYLHALAEKWGYFLFISFLEGKKEEEKEGKSDEIEGKLQNDFDKI